MDGMGDQDTGDDTQAQDSQPEEEPITTEEITSEFFDEVVTKVSNIIKDLHGEQQYNLSDNINRLLQVAQCYRQSYIEEKDNVFKMQSEVEKAAHKVSDANKMSQADQDMIESLKGQIDDAWKLADSAQIREQEAQESMYAMREKLEKLQREAERSADRGDGEEMGGSSMMKQRENVMRDRDRLQTEVEDLTKRFTSQKTYVEELEKKHDDAKAQVKSMTKQLDELTNEQFREKRIMEALQADLKDLTLENENMTEELKTLRLTATQNHRSLLQQTLQIAAHRATIEKQNATLSVNAIKLAKLNSDLDGMAQMKEKVTHELNTKLNLLKMKEDENNKFRLENSKMAKQKEGLTKKLVTAIGLKTSLEQDVAKLKTALTNFDKEREADKKTLDQTKKLSEGLIRERDLARKDLLKAQKQMSELKNQIFLNEQHQKTLENDLKSRTTTEHKLKSLLAKAEKEREKLLEESQNLHEKLQASNDEIIQKQTQMNELKDKITEITQKISQVQQSYEGMKVEKSVLQRDLLTCNDEKNEFRDRLKASAGIIEQLRENLSKKGMDITRINKVVEKTEKDKQALKAELQISIIALQHAKTELQELKVQNGRFQKTILDDEENMNKLRKRLDATIHEKDVVGTQLIRKNDEMNSLKEKISIIQLALDRGESQYAKRLDDIRLLKIEIKNLRSTRNLLTRGLANTADMRQEVLQLNRNLTQERVKAKALEMEMLTPMNVHRWRKLKGTDPEKSDLIDKVQTLQKHILSQSAVAVNRENEMENFQALYDSLKMFVLKIPSHDVKERLNSTQRSLTARTKKVKALSAELNTKEDDLKVKECLVEHLKSELQKTKNELNILKKKKQTEVVESKFEI